MDPCRVRWCMVSEIITDKRHISRLRAAYDVAFAQLAREVGVWQELRSRNPHPSAVERSSPQSTQSRSRLPRMPERHLLRPDRTHLIESASKHRIKLGLILVHALNDRLRMFPCAILDDLHKKGCSEDHEWTRDEASALRSRPGILNTLRTPSLSLASGAAMLSDQPAPAARARRTEAPHRLQTPTSTSRERDSI